MQEICDEIVVLGCQHGLDSDTAQCSNTSTPPSRPAGYAPTMDYFSPLRPRLNNLPCLSPSGDIIPPIRILPYNTSHFRLTVELRAQDTGIDRSYRQHHTLLTIEGVNLLLMRYLVDPEAVLREYFNWTQAEPKASPRSKPGAKPQPQPQPQPLIVDDSDPFADIG